MGRQETPRSLKKLKSVPKMVNRVPESAPIMLSGWTRRENRQAYAFDPSERLEASYRWPKELRPRKHMRKVCSMCRQQVLPARDFDTSRRGQYRQSQSAVLLGIYGA